MRIIFLLIALAHSTIVVGGEAQTLRSLTVLVDPNGNSNTISDLSFSDNGNMLAVAYGKFVGLLQEPIPGQAIVWDVKTGKRLKAFRDFQDGVSCLDFSSNGKHLAMGGFDGRVQVWQTEEWKRQSVIPASKGIVTSIHFHPKNSTLAVGTWQGQTGDLNSIKLHRCSTGELVGSLREHKDGVTSVQFTPDGQSILSTAMDGTVRLWDVDRKTARVIYQTDPIEFFYAVAVSPDGRFLVTGGGSLATEKWRVLVWETKTLKLVRDLSEDGQWIRSVRFTRDSKRLATASQDGEARIWNVEDFQSVRLPQRASRVAFSPDGTLIALAHGRTVKVLSTEHLIDED